ncbi:inosine-uridine nucleoside N-ribohydrolase [Agrococcus baldri]|uniref:Inosine-uridine nucleoside N-ribohydrolase n=1 Tax=Agrococcus baldri TaxID=153730 RepID=A0AA87RA22_9MICO|nr:inosine-uridine nucleoside N-ribohydrolase [Agrococcus baldri]
MLLDVDTGIDDALAILTAALSNEIDLVGCTVTWGNVDVAQGARNTSEVLRLAGHADVPVAIGAAGPRTGAVATFSPEVHGEDGLGGCADTAHVPVLSRNGLAPESAVEMMIRLSHEHAGTLEIVAVGPLTNLAAALDADPTLPERIRQVTVMGGAALAPGNVSDTAEANIWHDPEAAQVVFDASWELTMVGLDVTMTSLITDEHRARLAAGGEIGRFCAAILDFYLGYYEGWSGERASGNHDALALAVATGLVKTTLSPIVDVHVDCSAGETRGRTVTTLEGEWGQWPEREGARHRVVMEVEPGFEERMIDLLASA